MKILILYTLCFFSISLNAFDLQSGDVILISFNCYECRVIESETNSKVSHSGVVLKDSQKGIQVAQALSTVRVSPLQEFLKNKTPDSAVLVYRPLEFESRVDFYALDKQLHETFNRDFLGLGFDTQYLWNNVDEHGKELLYCSEFVAKFLDRFLSTPSPLFPLSFKKNYDYWRHHFNGNIPEGELGNSPTSFLSDTRLRFMGTL